MRLDLLTPADADALHAVLDDDALHTFTGGEPPTPAEWRRRVAAWQAGRSPDGAEQWRNWVVRDARGTVVGHAQATVRGDAAELAWVIGTAHQGRGLATAAARAMVALLQADGVASFTAHVHPDHVASQRVAAAVGMHDTGEVDADGEHLWASA